MAIESNGRQRATRLSSGSVKRRVYVEESDDSEEVAGLGEPSDSEEDFKPEVKSKKRSGHRGKRKEATPSSEEFQDEEDEDDDDEDGNGGAMEGGIDEESEDEETPRKRQKVKAEDYQEVIDIVQAPKGKVPRGTISPHLMKFMRDLKDPVKNDRDWFAQHKNIYDYIYKNWLEFVEACTDEFIDKVDDTIAYLPPKTLVERIYRDVRFSNDKTPYKKHLSWCLSRNGRKGSFGKYYFCVSAGSSGLHAGMYEPSKEELQTVRRNVLERTEHGMVLRELVKDKGFCRQFGAPPKGAGKSPKRTSLWGAEDELKRSPKDYAPDHPDIDWLKLKHFTVSHSFTDEEVLSPNFMDMLVQVARAAKPLVELMNDMLHGAGPTVPADRL